ncbi:MAG: thermonuclease family protein [Nitrosopumilaceae archaeon]|nr:thermonuclease family protein [Nitrosopumilaceae archaeon]
MRTLVIVGILIVGIIGTIAVFASMPSETWKNNRAGFTGVPLPDENKEKIDCLSRGGLWNNGCSIERRNVSNQDDVGVTCLGNAECLALNVDKIIDGDTIYADSYKIRLSLVNTPEKWEPGFTQATSFTAMSCPVGSRIIVDQDDGQPHDQYDRLLGKVYCENGILNEILLRNGHAKILPRYCFTSEFAGESWAQEYGCPEPNFDNIESNCDPSYPDFCIAPNHPDLDCGAISEKNFRVLPPDPHRFDGDKNGIGCENN